MLQQSQGQWKCYYRAVDKYGHVIDCFSVTAVMKKRLAPSLSRL
uniref:Uncharacterized protein n=1 Tax=Vibrio genomosp. F6 TaxID=723172 RepID=A0A0H3ZZ02_9VIBR|nr:hypothetical protein [Vibrio genomosp. F6]AKN39109.1 hypothetical protein [Vibrio genomosp. F6]